MKNLILIGLFITIFSSLHAQSEFDDLRFLVVFQEGTPQNEIDEVMVAHDAFEIWVSPFSEVRYWQSNGYPHYVGNDYIGDVKEEVDRLKGRPIVTGSGLDYDVISIFDESGISGGAQQFNCFTHFEPTSIASTNNTILSILDTGLSPAGTYPHQYTFSYGDYTGYNYIDNIPDVSDENSHGTHIAGITSHVSQHYNQSNALFSDISFDIRQVFNYQGIGKISDIIYGFDEAVLLGAEIVNMSFAFHSERPSQKPDPLEHSITKAAQEEVLVICAAGNEQINNDLDLYPAFPASYNCDNILSVASVNCSSNLSDFSNFGQKSVDIAFLGEIIPGPSPEGDLIFKSGTSQATAVVSGIAAATASYLSTPDYKKVKCAILSTAQFNQELSGLVFISGIADARAAASVMALENCDGINSGHSGNIRSHSNGIVESLNWNISPNPIKNDAVLSFHSKTNSKYKIQVLTIQGELVLTKHIESSIGANTIHLDDFSQFEKGTYFIGISNDEFIEYERIVKL